MNTSANNTRCIDYLLSRGAKVRTAILHYAPDSATVEAATLGSLVEGQRYSLVLKCDSLAPDALERIVKSAVKNQEHRTRTRRRTTYLSGLNIPLAELTVETATTPTTRRQKMNTSQQIQLQPLYGVPVVCACEGDRYALVAHAVIRALNELRDSTGMHIVLLTQRDDPKAEPVSWRIGWDFAQAPAAYYLVEDCSHQYDGLYGTQVWRIEDGRVTHSAWFEGCGSVERGLKELIDLYSLSESVEDLTVVQGRDADGCGRLYYLAF